VKPLIHRLKFISCILLILFAGSTAVFAQTKVPTPEDSTQDVEILNATKLLTFKTINDTTKLTIIVGDVKLRQGKTLFYCDSCVINNNTKIFEAWGKGGKVHINDSDTTNIYSSHLLYYMRTKLANLDGGVRLTDGKATLTTPDLEYDMETNIGIYKNGGKVVNKKTTLTSKEGWYYADMKDIYFKKNVVLKDPAYNIVTDSLLYNSKTQTTKFIAETTITDSSGRVIKTKEGFYNQQTGKAEFGQRPTVIDGTTEIRAGTITIDDSTGISIARDNAIIIDKKNKTTIIAGIIFRNKKTDAIMAIRKPLMIIEQDNDSIYISADTLFSARLTDLYRSQRYAMSSDSASKTDSNGNERVKDTLAINLVTRDTVLIEQPVDSTVLKTDSTILKDSLVTHIDKDTVIKQPSDIGKIKDTVTANTFRGQERFFGKRSLPIANTTARKDSTVIQTKKGVKRVEINEKDSTNRYFEAYRNVRIYNDSLQAVCDSMFYSFQDSVFRLFDDPAVWAQKSQITGDTINLFTKNKKADKVEAYENGFMINQLDSQAYNQIKSTRIDGYFINGDIDSVRAKGNAECIYYIQDDDSAYTGINQSTSDVMDIYFRNKELFKVVFRSAVTGTIWPIRQKSPTEMRLPNFKWLENRRPKSKTEMFE
jgi:lipopolysaccharide export system protein LptA